ncbi:hypothetical protein [uncultured Selenomonas sp.]|uniref:hypothetical protein n=1 Tax=uncultured Selenomonas sp. TaxID=159275 RepID=UPI0028DBBDBD|nr:hypothetical protein [uncultured Selenomonas sp.]
MTDEQRKQLSIELDQEAERAALRIRENFRATQPQPCTRFRNAGTVEWIVKLMEETNEAVQEAYTVSQLRQSNKKFPCEAMNEVVQGARERLAMELTDVIHVCVSWLNAEGWDEEARGELHRRVNEKNKKRGYF